MQSLFQAPPSPSAGLAPPRPSQLPAPAPANHASRENASILGPPRQSTSRGTASSSRPTSADFLPPSGPAGAPAALPHTPSRGSLPSAPQGGIPTPGRRICTPPLAGALSIASIAPAATKPSMIPLRSSTPASSKKGGGPRTANAFPPTPPHSHFNQPTAEAAYGMAAPTPPRLTPYQQQQQQATPYCNGQHDSSSGGGGLGGGGQPSGGFGGGGHGGGSGFSGCSDSAGLTPAQARLQRKREDADRRSMELQQAILQQSSSNVAQQVTNRTACSANRTATLARTPPPLAPPANSHPTPLRAPTRGPATVSLLRVALPPYGPYPPSLLRVACRSGGGAKPLVHIK